MSSGFRVKNFRVFYRETWSGSDLIAPYNSFVSYGNRMTGAGQSQAKCQVLRQIFALSCWLILTALSSPDVGSANVVGRTAGEFTVNSTGGATYRIPITVAAGQNGMKPEISLGYSSGRGDGLAGIGWTISGLSQITRCGLTPAIDGKYQGVKFSREDRYCLDGNPLLRKLNGNYWSGGQEYRTEIHNYEKITSVDSVGSGEGAGPKYFEVQRRNGLTYRYGFNENSRVEAVGNPDGAVRIWALDEIRDSYNTRIYYSYEEDSLTGTFRPASIKWSARDGGTENNARFRLIFAYEDRPAEAKRSGYTWGSVWALEKRLKYIDYDYKVSGSFSRVHRYTLNYKTVSNGSGRSVLDSVQQCGPGTAPDCLPATTFDSHTNVQGWHFVGGGESASGYLVENAMPGDFNGDGRQDLFVPKSGSWYVLLGSWDSWQKIEWSELEYGFSTGKSAATPGSTRIIDYNGDGLSDLLTPDVTGNYWHVYLSNGVTLSNLNINIPKTEFTDPIVMDLNGDGLDEILYRYNSGIMKVRNNNGNGFDAPSVATDKLNGAGPDIRYPGQRADFDGDGRDDYFEYGLCIGEGCGSSNDDIRIYISNGTGFDYEGYFDTDAMLVYGYDRRTADVNGDGLSDLIFVGVGNGSHPTWHTMLSHGHGLDDSVDTSIVYPEGLTVETPFTFADYNMDGRDDLVVGVKGSGGGWKVYPSNGRTFTSVGITLAGMATPGSDTVFAIDIGGTGYPSLVFSNDHNEDWFAYGHEGGEGTPRGPDSLTNVTDGLRNYFNINSRPISRVASYSSNAIPPVEREFHAGSYYVVDEYESNDGTASGSYEISYHYSDPKQDMQGRGFLGFNAVKLTDSRDDTYTVSTYRQDFPYIGRIDEVVRYQSDGQIITEHDLTWENYSQWASGDNKYYYFVHLAQSPAIGSNTDEYEVDPDGGSNGQLVRTTKHIVQYDFNHGAIKQDVMYEGSPAYPIILKTTVNTQFKGFSGSVYCLGFPSKIDVIKFDGVKSQRLRTVRNYYNSQCLRTSENVGPENIPGQQLVTTYAVDTEGKVTSVTRDSGDGAAADRKNIIGWDTIGGYRPVSETAVITGETNLTVQRTWNYGLGLEASRTDPRGQTTSWQYDDFGRLELETRPGPATTTVTIESCTSCFPTSAQYIVRSQRPDGFWFESYHDSYGRVVGQASVVLAGASTTETHATIGYDSLGRVVSKDVPHLVGNTLYSVDYLYDLRGRIKLESRPNSNPSNPPDDTLWIYDRLNTIVTDANGSATTYQNDALGNLVGVQGPLGSGAQYEYWPHGELRSISQDGVIIKSMTYDDRGYPAAMSDIDSGTWSYSYGVFGELLSQVDDVLPSPNTIIMAYDQLGRPRQRLEAEGTTDWIYHQSGSGLGLLDEVTGPLPSHGQASGSCADGTGYCEKYIYDQIGRLQQMTHRIGSSIYLTNYGYNNDSQVTSVTYPAMLSGNRYSFLYTYSNGHLDTIAKDMGSGVANTIYDIVNHDSFGNEELGKLFGDFGSGPTEYDHQRLHYRSDGRVQSIMTGQSLLGSSVQNYLYMWNATGDLMSREDNNQSGLTETFTYDALHRLDKTFLDGVEASDIDYHTNGNIQTRSDVGTYNYDGPVGSRAVTSVTEGPRLNTYHYDANGNMDCRGDSVSACTNGNSIEWTSFNKPQLINEGSNSSKLDYGPNRNRIRQIRKTSSESWKIQYVGTHFEKESNGKGKTRWRANVFANGRVVYQIHEHLTKGACSSQQGSQGYFVLRDHQNSVDALLADGTSNDIQYSFDAFGKRRNVDGWTADTTDVLLYLNKKTRKGYTGHEHLDNTKLIHMKGRVQDPILGRMISPDPLLGNLKNPQSLNSYSYVMNNPVSLTDPSGFDSACPSGTECITLGGSHGEVNIYVVDFPDGAGGNVAHGMDKAGNDAIFFDAAGLKSDLSRLDRAFEAKAIQIQSSIDYSSSLDKMNNISGVSQSIVSRSLRGVSQGDDSLIDQDFNVGINLPQSTGMLVFGGVETGADIFAGVFGVSGSIGGFREVRKNGKACGFNQVCVQFGVGGFAGVTGQGIIGISAPLENGTFSTLGVFAIGSTGGGGFGTLDVNSSSGTLGGGFTKGVGGAVGIQFCRFDVYGCQ